MDLNILNSKPNLHAITSNLLRSDGFYQMSNVSAICANQTLEYICDISEIDGYLVLGPELIPICMMAALIGAFSFFNIRNLPQNTRGRIAYSITFAMFGTMMSDAAYNDCWISVNPGTNPNFDLFIGLLDVGLTSSIGLSFFWNGLIDIGALNENWKTFTAMFVSYASLFAGWYYVIVNQDWDGFLYLYVYVIGISCGIYCILETIHIIKSKSAAGLGWVGVAGVTGAVGLGGIYFPSFDYWLCTTFGCHFAGDFVWFLLTDVAMFSCYKYFMARATLNQSSPPSKGYIPLTVMN